MLQKNQLHDLKILYFAMKAQLSVSELADFLELSPRALKERIRIVNQTFAEEFDRPAVLVVGADGILTIHARYIPEKLILFYSLKLFYLKDSFEFQILSYLLIHYSASSDTLCDELFISKSYLLRLLKTINHNLAALRIRIDSSDNRWRLKGDEVMIRLLGFLMLSDAYQSLEWPYEAIPKDELEAYLSDDFIRRFSIARKDHLLHFFASLSVRFNNQEFVQFRNDPKLRELFEMLKANHDLASLYDGEATMGLPLGSQIAENLYFNFVSRLYLEDLIPDAKKLVMGKKLANSENYFAVLAKRLLARLLQATTFELTPHQEYVVIYGLTLFFAYYYFGDNRIAALNSYVFDVPHFNIAIEGAYSKRIEQLVQAFIHENELTFLDSDATVFTLSNLLRTGSQIQAGNAVCIYIHIVKNFVEKVILEELIQKVFNPSSARVTRDFSQADILITDSFEPARDELKIYYYDGLQNQQQWPGLMKLIEDSILEKMFASPHTWLRDRI